MLALAMLAVLPLTLLQTPPATPAGTPAAVHERCVVVPADLLAWVSLGILPDTGATLPAAWMVKSGDFENVWFLAGDLVGPDLDADDIALWATSAPAEDGTYATGDGGLVLSVNGLASEFSDWLPAADYDISPVDDGAELAMECAEGT